MLTHVKAHFVVVAAVSALSAASVALFLRAAPPADSATAAAVRAVGTDDAHPKDVVGLWTRWPAAKSDGDRVRFYFFHEKGIGLYRFGKIGLNTTSSFDWHVETASDGRRDLVLTFRKTGEVKRTPYEVAQGKTRSLVMVKDPKEPLVGAIAYTYVPPPALAALAPDLAPDLASAAGGADLGAPQGIGGRMWIDESAYATGGKAFAMYQLKDTALDGRGVGWHHVGDYDDWSTEALSFRYTASSCKNDASLDLHFNVRDERASTVVVRGEGGGLHAERGDLVLVEDPRSFWHVRRYKDGGRSFAFLR